MSVARVVSYIGTPVPGLAKDACPARGGEEGLGIMVNCAQ